MNKEFLNDIIYELMTEMGLSVDSDNNVIVQSERTPLKFSDKTLKFNYNQQIMIDGSKEEWFDPFHNYELMLRLFNWYTIILKSDKNKKVLNFKEEVNPCNPNQFRLIVSVDHNGMRDRMEGNYFFNKCFCYLEFILNGIISFENMNL